LPEQAKPGPMPADNRLRLDDHQGVQNTGCKPIKAGENEPVEIAENKNIKETEMRRSGVLITTAALVAALVVGVKLPKKGTAGAEKLRRVGSAEAVCELNVTGGPEA
jgi:hypothetical protein